MKEVDKIFQEIMEIEEETRNEVEGQASLFDDVLDYPGEDAELYDPEDADKV